MSLKSTDQSLKSPLGFSNQPDTSQAIKCEIPQTLRHSKKQKAPTTRFANSTARFDGSR